MIIPLAQLVLGSGVIGLLLSLAVLGLIVWLLVSYIPMPAPLKNIIIVVAAIVAIVVACRFFGILVI